MANNSFWKSFWFTAIFIFLAFVLHFLLIFGLRHYNSGASFDVWNQIINGEASADILINGSSRALINFDCQAITKVTQRSCYNIGLDGSKINLDVARFKTYLKYNKKPKVLIQVGGIGDLGFGGFARLYQYTPYLNEEEIYKSLVSQSSMMRYHKYIPLYSFAVYNNELIWRAINGLLNVRDPETDWPRKPRVRGFLPVDISWTNEYDKFKLKFPKGEKFEISPKAISAYQELFRLCQEQNIQVLIVFPPAYYESVYQYTQNVGEIFRTYRELSTENHIKFLDYSKIPMTQDRKYFYNSQHMNRDGAGLFSHLFAEDLKAQVNLSP